MILLQTLVFTIKDLWTKNRYMAERMEIINKTEKELKKKFKEAETLCLKAEIEIEKVKYHSKDKSAIIDELFEAEIQNAILEQSANTSIMIEECLRTQGMFQWYNRPVGYLDVAQKVGIS